MTANKVYPLGITATMTGAVDLLGDPVKVVLVDAGYSYNDAHEFLTDVPGGARLATGTLTTKTVVGGLFAADPVTLPAIAAGDTGTGLVVYVDTGVEATAPLLAYIGRRADTIPLEVVTTGGDLVLSFPQGIYRL